MEKEKECHIKILMDDIETEIKSVKKSKEEILSILDELETREKEYAMSEIEI